MARTGKASLALQVYFQTSADSCVSLLIAPMPAPPLDNIVETGNPLPLGEGKGAFGPHPEKDLTNFF